MVLLLNLNCYAKVMEAAIQDSSTIWYECGYCEKSCNNAISCQMYNSWMNTDVLDVFKDIQSVLSLLSFRRPRKISACGQMRRICKADLRTTSPFHIVEKTLL